MNSTAEIECDSLTVLMIRSIDSVNAFVLRESRIDSKRLCAGPRLKERLRQLNQYDRYWIAVVGSSDVADRLRHTIYGRKSVEWDRLEYTSVDPIYKLQEPLTGKELIALFDGLLCD